MSTDLTLLEDWLECIFRDHKLSYLYIFEAFQLIEAMDEPEAIFNQYWEYEKLQPNGLRLKEMFSGANVIEIDSITMQKIYLEDLKERFCGNEFDTIRDWYLNCHENSIGYSPYN